ncbi:LysR substrate-binding domain-containing protein [Cupriavidus consociatus]|uniref:LysR substrate-binding domain-containing protein n=1 Tax=Cupriavidus consociatus TaxID=2821357 RepID=UPI001FD810FC|nr:MULTISPECIES: LysR family transcriptional regulator [unclassified Cupriavidus]MDK2662061.1 LysR substrate-binding domain-containing protein [Cupriavidus sp. LEh21]
MEERIGTRLVVRTTRMLALTEAGRAYYERSKRLLAEIDELEAGLTADATTPMGRLVIYGPTLFGRVFMLPLLARFLIQYPKVSLDVTLLDRPINLVEEGVDVAVRIGSIEDSSLIVRKLGALRWVVAASPEYVATHGEPRHPSELSGHHCLVYSQLSISAEWQMLDDNGRPAHVQVPVRMRSNTLDGVIAAAIEGAGLVYAPAWSVAHHVSAGRLKIVLSDFELPGRDINLIFTHNRLLAGKVRALIDFFVENLSDVNFDTVPPYGAVSQLDAASA